MPLLPAEIVRSWNESPLIRPGFTDPFCAACCAGEVRAVPKSSTSLTGPSSPTRPIIMEERTRMAAPLMVNLDEIDQSHDEYTIEDIRKYLPQRYEFEQVSGVFKLLRDLPEPIAVGYRDVGHDEFWKRGHIPGRPLFPGVLMLEAAAQLSTFMFKLLSGDDPNRFLGFGGLEKVRFRGVVAPGDRLIIISKQIEARPRRCMYLTQGVVNGRLVFDAQIIGVPV